MRYLQFAGCLTSWAGKNIVGCVTGIVLMLVVLTNFWHSRYNNPEGVIEWDVKSYYAWLPAAFVYNDLSLEFRRENTEKFGELIWPVETPIGKQAIVTTMGMAVLYSPFFFTAHLVALISPYEADGYSRPYRFALTFSALFYLWAGMFFLGKVLLTFFNRYITAITLIAVTLGTNLYYYSTYEAPMSHVFNFALIAWFLWITVRFYKMPSMKIIVAAGLVSGLITLIRPTNIIILLIFFLWNIKSYTGLKERTLFFLKRWHWVLLMAIAFVLVWVPQFLYWYQVSGQIFYFSYGELGGRFFFDNPQIFNILLSIKKGWLVYTPVMGFAFAGMVVLIRRRSGPALAVTTFVILNIYILSSWWNWWYGGGFGLRSFIDSYAVMAIPLAAFLEFICTRKNIIRYPVLILTGLLVAFSLFQTRQYVNNAIHWWWMNKEAYRETFLKLHPTEKYWEMITIPDHDMARQGIYREIMPRETQPVNRDDWKRIPDDEELITWIAENWHANDITRELSGNDYPTAGNDNITDEALQLFMTRGRDYFEREWAIDLITKEIRSNPAMVEYIREKAEKNKISFDSMLLLDALWLYKNQR